ncbi:hypothetical protein PISMIDRAFT_690638, partial [Pisolithus microcarpus 441]
VTFFQIIPTASFVLRTTPLFPRTDLFVCVLPNLPRDNKRPWVVFPAFFAPVCSRQMPEASTLKAPIACFKQHVKTSRLYE